MKYLKFVLFVFFATMTTFAFAEAPRNSFEKIEASFKRGEMSESDSMGLKVLAFFHDTKLPLSYLADPGAVILETPDSVVNQAAPFLPSMTSSIAISVFNYMIPPPYRSVQNLKVGEPTFKLMEEEVPTPNLIPRLDWDHIDNVYSNIRVWYEKDDTDQFLMATKIRDLLSNKIIPDIKKLTGRTHLPDDIVNSSLAVTLGISRTIPNGGDGKLDIYLHNLAILEGDTSAAKGWTQRYKFGAANGFNCPAQPAYMAFNFNWAKSATEEKFASTLAHEYFHIVQHSYDRKGDCLEYYDLDEGVATWIKHYVFPDYNDEHVWFSFSENGRQSLMNGAYETWPFYFFMTNYNGDSIIAKMYELQANELSIESINKALPGGFKEQWPIYALYEWNQDPLQDSFKDWDKYYVKPGRGAANTGEHLPPIEIEKVTLDTNGQFSRVMDFELKPLTRDFYAFDLSDNEIRSISIDNPVFYNAKKVTVKALVRKKGQSQFEELTWTDSKRDEYEYCLDNKEEQIDMVVLVVANYLHKVDAPTYRNTSVFKVSNQGCHKIGGTIKSHVWVKEVAKVYDMKVEATQLVFKADPRLPSGGFNGHFHLESGVVSYSFEGTSDGCDAKESGNAIVKTGIGPIALGIYPYNVAPQAWGTYSVSVPLQESFIIAHYVCPPPKKSFDVSIPIVLNSGFTNGKEHRHDGFDHWKDMWETPILRVEWDLFPIRE